MIPDTLFEAWEWLLSLSKVQLLLVGGGVALLVAVSKVLRYLFLVIVLLLFLLVLFDKVLLQSENIPMPSALSGALPRGR